MDDSTTNPFLEKYCIAFKGKIDKVRYYCNIQVLIRNNFKQHRIQTSQTFQVHSGIDIHYLGVILYSSTIFIQTYIRVATTIEKLNSTTF